MSRAAVTLSILMLTSFCTALAQEEAAVAPGPCSKFLQVYATYDELEKGKLVDKVSIGDLTDWSRNSAFEGLVSTKDTPAGAKLTLEVKYPKAPKKNKKIEATFKDWKLDANYRLADLDIHSALDKRPEVPGTYTVRLISGDKTLCTESKDIVIDDE